MTAQTILPANSASSGSYQVDNSVRFDDGSGDILARSNGTPSSQRLFTFSGWYKKATLASGVNFQFFALYNDNTDRMDFRFQDGDTIDFRNNAPRCRITTNRLFRDPSAWYHVVLRVDTTQSTAANRIRLYVNGVQETSFSAADYGDQNDDLITDASTFAVGDDSYGNAHYDGNMCEVVYCDGQSLAPTSFGQFDNSGIWKPRDVSGLTFGDQGFYLEFKGTGTSANASGIGADTSGNTNHLTVTALTATSQSTDTCTNNFATLNPLMNNKVNLPTLSEANLEVLAVSGSTWSVTPGTIGLPRSGKWYYEVEAVSGTSGDRAAFAGWMNPAVTNPLGNGSILWRNVSANNSILSNDSAASGTFSATTWGTNGHIIGLYIDMDNSKLYFAHNGTIQNSGTGIDFQGTFDDDTFILPVVMVINTDKLSVNFGNPAANFAIASGNADVNGFGNFEYDPSAGSFDGASKDFLAICTKNLAEVT